MTTTTTEPTDEVIDYDRLSASIGALTDNQVLAIQHLMEWLATAPALDYGVAEVLRELANHAHDVLAARRYFDDEGVWVHDRTGSSHCDGQSGPFKAEPLEPMGNGHKCVNCNGRINSVPGEAS